MKKKSKKMESEKKKDGDLLAFGSERPARPLSH